MSEATSTPTDTASLVADLGAARYLALTTFRRSGAAVTTPVWPVTLNGKLYVGTFASTGKAKRLRNNPRVRFAVCTGNGKQILSDWYDGRARILTDEELGREYLAAATRKYGWQQHIIMLLHRLRGRLQEKVLLEIDVTAEP